MSFTIIAQLIDLLYPYYCVGCGHSGTLLCDDCYCEIDYYYTQVLLDLEPRYIDEYLVSAHLEGVGRKLVHTLKYSGVTEVASYIGELIYQSTEWPDADLVTAVPLHAKRLGERGFNQAALIAQTVASRAGIPYADLLLRTSNTPHQAQLQNKTDRVLNITDYFALKKRDDKQRSLKGLHVILIDDVATTGITLNQCAKVLKSAGCQKVTAITFAHGK